MVIVRIYANFEMELFYLNVNVVVVFPRSHVLLVLVPGKMRPSVSPTVEELFSLGGNSSGNASNSSFMRRERLNIHQSANLLNCETKRCEEN